MKKILESAKLEMREAVEHLSDEFFRIFPEQADSRLLEGIQVDYYGVLSSILHISHFSILDSTVSMLQPFDKNMTAQIEKSISESDRDILTEIIGDKIFLKLSPLTGEIRKRKAEKRKKVCEKAKKTVLSIREKVLQKLQEEDFSEDERKFFETQIQHLSGEYCGRISDMNSMYC